MFRRRDHQLEMRLQNALDSGCSVWVVGDIHGHLDAFENLLEQMELAPGDHVLCLGDLIDRGQDSAGVVRPVRQSEIIHRIMGAQVGGSGWQHHRRQRLDVEWRA